MKIFATTLPCPWVIRCASIATALAICPLMEQAQAQSPNAIACSKVPTAFRSSDEVFSSFACRGDRSALVMRALDMTEADVKIQSAIQKSVSANLTLKSLDKAYELARSAPTKLRRFLGLSVIGNAVYPALDLSLVDTVTTEDWSPKLSAHTDARTSPALKTEASRMLRELAKNAASEDVRLRSQQLLERLSRHLTPPGSS